MSASPSSTSSSAAVPSETPADISLSFKVLKAGEGYPVYMFTVNKTIMLRGRTPIERIKSAVVHIDNVYAALPHYFVCGQDTSFVLVDDEMTRTLGRSASNEHAVYVSGWLHATEMVNCELKELRTRAFYPLDTIKQKLLLLIQNQLGETPQAQSETPQAQSETPQAQSEREIALNEREHTLNEREIALNERENSMNTTQQQFNVSNNDQMNQIQALVYTYEQDRKKFEEDKQKFEQDRKKFEQDKQKYEQDRKKFGEDKQKYEQDIVKLYREQAKLAREQAALKTAKIKLQQQIKKNRESIDESGSGSEAESESESESDEDNDDDDESEDTASSSRKRKRVESKDKGHPMGKNAHKAWKLQQLEATRREYAEIIGHKPGNRILNNVKQMKKAIEKAKRVNSGR